MATDPQPYRSSWLDWAVAAIEAAPGPSLLTYGILAALFLLVTGAQGWLAGQAPVGTWPPQALVWGLAPVAGLWVWGHLNRLARDAFDAFRPAISADVMDLEGARRELTTMPWLPALLILIGSYPFTLLYYASDPAASGVVGMPIGALAIRATTEGFFTAQTIVLILHGFRQLRLVRRLHARADRIDLFHQAPLHAFSRLTAQTGMVLVVIIAAGLVANPSSVPIDQVSLALWLPWLIGFPVAGLVLFLIPLLGMHGRLAGAKAQLQGATEERLKDILAELDRDVEAVSLNRADGLQKTLGSLMLERDIIGKLSTWPWSTGTLRGFVTAILLPLGLFLMQRLLAQIV